GFGPEIDAREQVGDPDSMNAAEDALNEISELAVAINLHASHPKRLIQPEQAVDSKLAPPRAYRGIAAPFVARSDRDDRDASVAERERMEDVAGRGVTEELAQLAAIGEQVESGAARDLEDEIADRFARPIRECDQLGEFAGRIFLAPRDRRRHLAAELVDDCAGAGGTARSHHPCDRSSRRDRLEIHRQVAPMARGLGQAATRIIESGRE